jgi:hypothetical protein
MTENIDNTLGRKIFFLHPSALVQNQVITELAQLEFEVYISKDEGKLKNLLAKYPDSIVFASISEGMKESAWEEWIRGVMANPGTSKIDIGIIVPISNEDLQRKYIQQLRASCGFTAIKSDPNGAIKQLVSILNDVNAKGRRKYIRALIDNGSNTTVNLPMNGTYVNGNIKDISVVGFSCCFTEDPVLNKNRLFDYMQIRLQSHLLKTEGIVFGSHMDGVEKVYVLLFTQRTDPEVRAKIRKYIQSNLQSKMDIELK